MRSAVCFSTLYISSVRFGLVRKFIFHLIMNKSPPGKLVSHALSVGLHETRKMISWCSSISQQSDCQKQMGFSRNTRPCCSLTPLPPSSLVPSFCLHSSSPYPFSPTTPPLELCQPFLENHASGHFLEPMLT